MNKNIDFPDYFMTKEDIVCHTISEFTTFGGRYVVGMPKYFPSDKHVENGKIIGGRPYHNHLSSFHDSMEKLRQICPGYLRFLPEFGEEIGLFDVDADIKKIYKPKAIARHIYENPVTDKIHIDTKELLTILVEGLGIEIDDIGIEGSIMMECFLENSDIDMVIYGEESVGKLMRGFHSLDGYECIHLYDETDIPLIHSRRGKYQSFSSKNELLLQEKRRTTGLINNRRFWAQPILGSDNNEEEIFKDRHLTKIDIIESEFTVTGSDGRFWPSIYRISNAKHADILLECYDPIYMNQAKEGDSIIVRGNLYKDMRSESLHIILAPWISTLQFLRNKDFISGGIHD